MKQPREFQRYIAFRTRQQALGAMEMLKRMRRTGAISSFSQGPQPYFQITTNCTYRESCEVLRTIAHCVRE